MLALTHSLPERETNSLNSNKDLNLVLFFQKIPTGRIHCVGITLK